MADREPLLVGQYWRHYKGNDYCIVALGREPTLEDVVVYRDVRSGEVWVRPKEVFLGRTRDRPIAPVHRFERRFPKRSL